jgi:hypothetical protein
VAQADQAALLAELEHLAEELRQRRQTAQPEAVERAKVRPLPAANIHHSD